MRHFSLSPLAMFNSLWLHRQLILTLVKRDVAGRYRGSVLGLLWSLFNPIFMLAVYTFVFSVVFRARWTVGEESRAMFALVLFAGLLLFNLFAECVNRAPGLILENVNYVKKVIFPLEVLPWVILGTALFHALVSFFVWLAFSFVVLGMPPLTILLFPLILLPLLLFILGLSWFLASLGVYLRDVGQFVGILTTTLLFLTPIFYPLTLIPESYQSIVLSNPLAFIVEQGRGLLIFGRLPNWSGYFTLMAATLLFAWGGFAWFQKTRKGFADVL